MRSALYGVLSAQFFSSLADNALLIIAIEILSQRQSPEWMTPLLKLFFTVSYVVLAPFVGAIADAYPKGRVMLAANMLKVLGCLMMFGPVNPLLAYAIVGFGAAAYSPAKYGILTELLPPKDLVVANGWMEGSTVISIIGGTMLGAAAINKSVIGYFDTLTGSSVWSGSISLSIVIFIYLIATFFNFKIPDTGARYSPRPHGLWNLIQDFSSSCEKLIKDRVGQMSLAVTSLFWGVGATLQFLMLEWARVSLNLPLEQAATLQGLAAFGIAIGSVLAARLVTLKTSLKVLPVGLLIGVSIAAMAVVSQKILALPLILTIGTFSGFFVVPMNALLQHRGHILMSAGHSIAVQNFTENVSILLMVGSYALLIMYEFDIHIVLLIFGFFVVVCMLLLMYTHRSSQQVLDEGEEAQKVGEKSS